MRCDLAKENIHCGVAGKLDKLGEHKWQGAGMLEDTAEAVSLISKCVVRLAAVPAHESATKDAGRGPRAMDKRRV